MQALRIDHVHLEVADRDAAAEWYARVLGLARHPTLARWAEDPMGPLILAGGDGFPTLSLFARAPKQVSRDTTVAFRVSGHDFLSFCDRLAELRLQDRDGKAVTRADTVDHGLSWSIYFLDPDGNRLELTTYDHADVAAARPSGALRATPQTPAIESGIWERERGFWLNGPAFYAEHMAPGAVMVFPPPVGILQGADILAGIEAGPRWDSVEMDEGAVSRHGETLVLTYRATGRRADAAPYVALCASTYVGGGGGWKLVLHQHTPAG